MVQLKIHLIYFKWNGQLNIPKRDINASQVLGSWAALGKAFQLSLWMLHFNKPESSAPFLLETGQKYML